MSSPETSDGRERGAKIFEFPRHEVTSGDPLDELLRAAARLAPQMGPELRAKMVRGLADIQGQRGEEVRDDLVARFPLIGPDGEPLFGNVVIRDMIAESGTRDGGSSGSGGRRQPGGTEIDTEPVGKKMGELVFLRDPQVPRTPGSGRRRHPRR